MSLRKEMKNWKHCALFESTLSTVFNFLCDLVFMDEYLFIFLLYIFPPKYALFCFCCTVFNENYPKKWSKTNNENVFITQHKLNPCVQNYENSPAHLSAVSILRHVMRIIKFVTIIPFYQHEAFLNILCMSMHVYSCNVIECYILSVLPLLSHYKQDTAPGY